MTTSPWPPLAASAAFALLIAWTSWCGGTVARVPSLPLWHRRGAGITALLVGPGALVAVALGAIETSTAVREGAWLWPLACLVALPQPLAALGRDRAPAWLVWPVTAWNLAALLDAAARTVDFAGLLVPDAIAPVLGAPRAAWVDTVGTTGLTAAWPVWVPVLVPVWPPRMRAARVVHVALVVMACTGAGAAMLGGLRLASMPSSYARFAADPLRERPGGDFAVGATAFGPVTAMVPAAVARLDMLSLDQLEATAVHVEVSARTPRVALDSLGRMLDARRRAGSAVVVTVRDLPANADADSAVVASVARRTAATTLIVSGPWEPMPVDRLAAGVARRAAAARAAGRAGLRIALALTAAEPRRHAWAAGPGSGIDEIALVVEPSPRGADAVGRQLATWSTWIAETGSLRRYWVLGAGGVPAAHGGRSQRQAVRGVLAWATSEGMVRGAIVADAGDHGRFTGLRTASYAWRPAAGTVLRAGRSIRETTAPAVAPAPVDTTSP